MNNIIQANFKGTKVLFKSDAYLHATEIAKKFNKKPKDYLRNERTKEYLNALNKKYGFQNNGVGRNRLTEQNQLVTIKQGGVEQGTWLHPKLAIDFARWLSADFAVWCDEQIENILFSKKQQPKIENPYIEGKELQHIKEGVSKVVKLTGKHFKVVYGDLNRYFGAPNINQIDKKYYRKVCDYLGISRDYVVPADTFNLIDNIANNNHVFGLSLLVKGEYAKRHQNRKFSNVEKLLNDAMVELEKARLLNADICDALSESRLYIDFDEREIKEATQKAKTEFYKKYGEHPI